MRSRLLVEQVQSLSKSGLKNHEIAKKLNKSTSNISRWCRKAKEISEPTPTSSYQEKARYQLLTSHHVDLDSLDKNLAMIILSTLYWCEGAKYPGSNRVDFVSSDEKMQITFLKLFRFVFNKEVSEKKFRVMLQLHESHDVNNTIDYWSSILGIPKEQFIKPHITKGKQTRYRHVYNGTCSLRYYDYKLLLKITGSFSQISDGLADSLI